MALGGTDAGVPFAFLAGVQLISVAAAIGLAGAACLPRLRRRTTPVFVAGALVFAVADALTATTYGHATSTRLAILRAAGTLLMAIGLANGVLRPPEVLRVSASTLPPAIGVGAVLVPLGAPVGPTIACAVTAALAALAALRGPRTDAIGAVLLAPAFAFLAVSGGLAHAAATSRAASLAVLTTRGCFALLVFAALARLALTSVLAKVVTAMLAGVMLMALGAVGVGSVVAGVVVRQQADQAKRVAQNQVDGIESLQDRAGFLAQVVTVCRSTTTPRQCREALRVFGALPAPFAATVSRDGKVTLLTDSEALPSSAALQLRGEDVVREVFAASPALRNGAATLAVLDGKLTVLGVAPIFPANAPPNAKPTEVAVYGGLINNGYTTDQQQATTYGVTILVNGRSAASSLTPRNAEAVVQIAQKVGVGTGALAGKPVVVHTAQGRAPTVAFSAITARDGTPIAVLAVSQPARTALAAERRAFTELFLTALGVMVLVSIMALLLGRRIVEPVRRLTVVSSRVRRGDLSARVGEAGADEVGQLSRAFDAMTSSVSQLTDDLRAAADAEGALRARLETVLAAMTDGLVATDDTGRITSINPAAAALIGVDTETALGQQVHDVVDARDADEQPVFARRIGPGHVAGALHRSDGTVVPVEVDVAALEEASGYVIAIRDQSRERELERLKTEFLSNLSHELRTPLTPIRGYAELLRRQSGLTRKKSVEYIDTILSSSARMQRVVDLLVDVAAIEAGRVRPKHVVVNVPRFVTERIDEWRTRYPHRADDFRRRVTRGIAPLMSDPTLLTKAMDELVDNAVKHTPAGTTITIAAAPGPPGHVQMSVRDAGAGIDADAMPHLFADFVQADGSATRAVGGLGLGLAYVRRLVEAMGLGLDVRSAPGRGAEFILDVPAATTDVVPRQRARAARGAGRRGAPRPTSARRRSPRTKRPDG